MAYYYYCTCNPKELSKTNIHKNSRHFREVKADKDGICLDCKHYAVASRERVDPYNGELYRKILQEKDIKEPTAISIKGGLTLKTQKDLKKYGKHRKDKDGNMDV
jgi:hypothetical protein